MKSAGPGEVTCMNFQVIGSRAWKQDGIFHGVPGTIPASYLYSELSLDNNGDINVEVEDTDPEFAMDDDEETSVIESESQVKVENEK